MSTFSVHGNVQPSISRHLRLKPRLQITPNPPFTDPTSLQTLLKKTRTSPLPSSSSNPSRRASQTRPPSTTPSVVSTLRNPIPPLFNKLPTTNTKDGRTPIQVQRQDDVRRLLRGRGARPEETRRRQVLHRVPRRPDRRRDRGRETCVQGRAGEDQEDGQDGHGRHGGRGDDGCLSASAASWNPCWNVLSVFWHVKCIRWGTLSGCAGI